MAGAKLDNLTPKQKKAMEYVVSAWKKSGETTAVLEEGLRVLSSAKRPPAYRISGEEKPYMAVACGYGKAYRDKLTLTKEESLAMLDMVAPLRQAACCERTARVMIELAAGVVLNGNEVPKTITDPAWEPVLRVLTEVAPSSIQRKMF